MRHRFAVRILGVVALSMGTVATSFAQLPANLPPGAATNPITRLLVTQPQVDVSSPVVANSSIDPALVRPGERGVYRVTFNALEAAIRLPEPFPAPPGLTIRPTAQGQILQVATNGFQPLTTFNFDVRVGRPGLFTIPRFIASVYGKPIVVPEVDMEALEVLPANHLPAQQIVLECGTTNAFVGQTIVVRAVSAAREGNSVQTLTQVQFRDEGFLPRKTPVRQVIETIERDGRRVPAYIYETTVTPIAVGELALSAQGFTAGRQFSGPITIQGTAVIPGGQPQYVLLDSEPVTIHVRPLPVETRLPGFTGNVGILSSDPPTVTPASVRVGDPVQLTVIVRSDGDLMRLIPPEPPRDRQWQVFPATPAGFVGATPNANPGAVFHYTLIPVTDDAGATPAMPFSYFDPGRAEYVDLTIPPVTVNVQPGELPVQAPLDWPELDEREKPPALSGLATAEGRKVSSLTPLQLRLWFPAMQLLPALGFLGLLIWDQRRRHLEQHPEIVRRRAARRALRRQRRLLKRAAAAGDAPGFARHSVTAMQVACAPHYPAEPRALVCGDVLSLIGPAEGNGKSAEVVRCFFAAVNDSRFAASPRDHVEVFALKSELDDVLKRLEARL